MEQFIDRFQFAAIVAGTFVSLWGFSMFWRCLWEVLRGYHDVKGLQGKCVGHAGWAMACIAVLCFSFARSCTLGILPFGPMGSGAAFLVGQIILVMTLGMSIWANTHDHVICKRSRIRIAVYYRTMFIIIVAFGIVGLLPSE
jgi:hypothetical protein